MNGCLLVRRGGAALSTYDYIATKKDINKRFSAITEPAHRGYKACLKKALEAENYPGALDDSPTLTLSEGVLIELILGSKNSSFRKLQTKIRACRKSNAANQQAVAALVKEYDKNEERGKRTGARAPRMIIHDKSARQLAQSLRGADWLASELKPLPGADALLVEVSTFKALRSQFDRSRFVNELMFLFSDAKDDDIRLRSERKSLASIVGDWSASTRLHADD